MKKNPRTCIRVFTTYKIIFMIQNIVDESLEMRIDIKSIFKIQKIYTIFPAVKIFLSTLFYALTSDT